MEKDKLTDNAGVLDKKMENSYKDIIKIPKETSERITSLRFILIVFVIFIHANLKEVDAVNYYHYDFNQPLWVEMVKTFICEILGCAAVPLFYLHHIYNFPKMIVI